MKPDATTCRALLREGLFPLTKLPSLLPHGPSGRRMHRALGWRWVRSGVLRPDGMRVHLEAVRVGKRWMTSEFAVARFLHRVSGGEVPAGSGEPSLSEATRQMLKEHGLDVRGAG